MPLKLIDNGDHFTALDESGNPVQQIAKAGLSAEYRANLESQAETIHPAAPITPVSITPVAPDQQQEMTSIAADAPVAVTEPVVGPAPNHGFDVVGNVKKDLKRIIGDSDENTKKELLAQWNTIRHHQINSNIPLDSDKIARAQVEARMKAVGMPIPADPIAPVQPLLKGAVNTQAPSLPATAFEALPATSAQRDQAQGLTPSEVVIQQQGSILDPATQKKLDEAYAAKINAAKIDAEQKRIYYQNEAVLRRDQAEAQAKLDAQEKERSERARSILDQKISQQEALLNEAKNAKINPGEWWESTSTFQKLMLGLASVAALGAETISEGQIANPVLPMVENAINQNMALQREKIQRTGEAANRMGQFIDRLKEQDLDERQQYLMQKQVLINTVENKLKEYQAQANSETTKATLENMRGNLSIEKEKTQAELAQKNVATAHLQAAQQPKVDRNEVAANSHVDAMLSNLDELEKLAKETSWGGIAASKTKKHAWDAAAAAVQLHYQALMGMKRLSAESAKLFGQLVPSKYESFRAEQIAEAKKQVLRERQAWVKSYQPNSAAENAVEEGNF